MDHTLIKEAYSRCNKWLNVRDSWPQLCLGLPLSSASHFTQVSRFPCLQHKQAGWDHLCHLTVTLGALRDTENLYRWLFIIIIASLFLLWLALFGVLLLGYISTYSLPIPVQIGGQRPSIERCYRGWTETPPLLWGETWASEICYVKTISCILNGFGRSIFSSWKGEGILCHEIQARKSGPSHYNKRNMHFKIKKTRLCCVLKKATFLWWWFIFAFRWKEASPDAPPAPPSMYQGFPLPPAEPTEAWAKGSRADPQLVCEARVL